MTKDNLFGVNVVGHVTGEFGLGEAVRANLRSMRTAGVPFVAKNIEVPWHRNLDKTFVEFISDEQPYPINLVNFNPDEDLYRKLGPTFFQGKYNIGYWSWELPQLFPGWIYAFDLFDEIWALSNYSARAIATVSPIPVMKLGLSMVLDKPQLNRIDLKLPQDKFIFLFMFDLLSTLGRKNPAATIRAFQQAFSRDNPNVMLVLKVSNADKLPLDRQKLRDLADNWPSIQFIEGHLDKAEVQALLYNCDCYVSLHRAEGFGLTMAEAMFHGKPVIATGYSSNIEFMDVNNSFLVKYKRVTIAENEGYYLKGNIWAEADVDHAASLMRYVFENYPEAQKVGEKAAKDIRYLLSPQTLGNQIKNRLEFIMGRINLGKVNLTNSQRMKKLDLMAEKEFWISQNSAWKQTAQDLQRSLKVSR